MDEQDGAQRDTLHNPEAQAAGINALTAGINPGMQGTSPFFADRNTGGLIRTCPHDQQMQSTRNTMTSGMTEFTAGTSTTPVNQMYRCRNPLVDRYLVRLSGLLQGVRCYTDASTSLDFPSLPPRNAGLGLFIVNTQVHPAQTIFVKAILTGAISVLMAEAAAMALAAIVTDCLNMQEIIFLSNNHMLVHFLNDLDHANPPELKIKHFTQIFTSSTSRRDARILRIQRTQNQTAGILARQALLESQPSSLNLASTCSNAAHVIQCPL
jgi:hypothetical protein